MVLFVQAWHIALFWITTPLHRALHYHCPPQVIWTVNSLCYIFLDDYQLKKGECALGTLRPVIIFQTWSRCYWQVKIHRTMIKEAAHINKEAKADPRSQKSKCTKHTISGRKGQVWLSSSPLVPQETNHSTCTPTGQDSTRLRLSKAPVFCFVIPRTSYACLQSRWKARHRLPRKDFLPLISRR